LLTTAQPDLIVDGQQVSPLQWLRDGGDVEVVRAIVEAADWAGR
jgi:hypothetical protein